MPYTRQQAMDFWLEFDDVFHFHTPAAVQAAYQQIQFNFDLAVNAFDDGRAAATFPASFVAAVQPFRPALAVLSQFQLDVIDRHFHGDVDSLRMSMEDFGQGVLFDNRRQAGVKIHMMDGSGVGNPPIGYHRWHAFNRAFQLLGLQEDRWKKIDQFVGLAWAIQSVLKPIQDRQNNPELTSARLSALRADWLAKTVDQIDAAFDSSPYPPGIT